MASGVSLGESLTHNSALTELRLAHNSLADPGIQAVSNYCKDCLGRYFRQRFLPASSSMVRAASILRQDEKL